jgi:FeS assembly SUF system regulator
MRPCAASKNRSRFGCFPLDAAPPVRHFLINQDWFSPVSRKRDKSEDSQAMLRLSKLTDYAVVVLVRLSGMEGVQTSPGLATATGIPEPTVAKVLKALTASDLVASQRGARGGYRLNRDLSGIPIADVIAAIDGPIALTACVEGTGLGCESQGLCPMRGRWDPVNDAIHKALSAITLADMQVTLPPAFHILEQHLPDQPPPNQPPEAALSAAAE